MQTHYERSWNVTDAGWLLMELEYFRRQQTPPQWKRRGATAKGPWALPF